MSIDFKKIFIVAEAGVNHNGSLKKAYKLVDIAKKCGADAVKFQTFIASEEISKGSPKAKYQINIKNKKEDQLEMVKKLEIPFIEQKKIFNYCKQKNIEFISSPFDIKSIDFLSKLKLNTLKIPSGEINNYPYLLHISEKKFKHIILSTGMSNIKEITNAIKLLQSKNKNKISILHCISAYPTNIEDINLNAINVLKKKFKKNVGFSDHTIGIDGSIYAVLAGAKIIEKHFTLNKNLKGPDHKLSLSPNELKQMIKKIRKVEKILGDGKKHVRKSELPNIHIVRKSIVAKKKIKVGDKFTKYNITTKRPGFGINPMNWKKIIGKKSKFSYEKDELINR